MNLQTLSLLNFRNYKSLEMNTEGAKTIFLVGENGQGKTNFLEAIHYLSFSSSFRTKKDETLIFHGEKEFSIRAEIQEEDIFHNIQISFSGKKKRREHNNTKIYDREEIIQFFPSLIFKHSDIFFITGTPEYQRYFIDQTLALTHLEYMQTLRQYKKTLRQKNMALKQRLFNLLPTYNEILAELGVKIIKQRREALDFFDKRIQKLFSKIFFHEQKEEEAQVCIKYAPSWRAETKEEAQKIIEKQGEKEKILLFCLSGPHRDRVEILLSDYAFKEVASTGQIRLLSLLMRTLQAEYYYLHTKKQMIYLFDDVLLELDMKKRDLFLETLPDSHQNFFTFLPDESLPSKFLSNKKTFYVEQGQLEEQKTL